MMRLEPNAVLKYFDPIDAFVKVRVFTGAEAGNLLRNARIPNRRAFVELVLNACVVNYTEQVMARLGSNVGPAERVSIEDRLFELCIQVNPSLDIHKISIPVSDAPAPEIHLLDHAPARRDVSRLRTIERDLASRVIGQRNAVLTVSRALKKAFTGLRDPDRPIAAFFFVGQTGVGKTELAKAITYTVSGDASRMVRVDCSEYALGHEYSKLIGAPPGYIGHDQSGILSEIIGRGPMVVLFDEIEKSDSKVHDLLLQAMDEGFVTDNKGGRIPFGETVLVLTSNVGAEELEALRHRIGFRLRPPSFSRETLFEEMFAGLRKRFRPEFINRVTDVVLFNAIGLAECVKIVRRFLDDVKRHAAAVPLRVEFSSAVAPLLAEKGFRPEYGARELRRTVERDVEGPLSDMIVEGHVHEGDLVRVRVSRDRLKFHRN